MEAQQQKILQQYLPDLVNQVNPQQLLPYLPCLTTYSQEMINAAQSSTGRSYAVQVLHGNLIKRPEGFDDLINALRDPSVNCTKLADHLADAYSNIRGGQSYGSRSYTRIDNGGMPDRQERLPGAVGNAAMLHSVTNRHSAFPSAASQQSGSTRATGSTTGTYSKAPCSLDTLWGQLPAGVQSILKRFDIRNSMKKPEDLADLLDFTNEDIEKIKSDLSSGDSLTLAIIKCHAQGESVTLHDIYKWFHQLDRKDILEELQKRTGVKFTPDPEVERYPQAEVRYSGAVRNEPLIYNRVDPNFNQPTDKLTGLRKSGPNGEELRVNRQTSVGLPQNNPDNIIYSRHNTIETDDKNHGWVKQHAGGIQVQQISDRPLEKNESPDKKGRFTGYKPEEIVTNMIDGTLVGANTRQDIQFKKAKYPEKHKEDNTRELFGELSSTEMKGSGGFQAVDAKQDEAERNMDIYRNNLDRSVSSCSSNTENSTYDSLTNNDGLTLGDREKSENDSDTNEVTKKEEYNKSTSDDCEHQSLDKESKPLKGLLEVNAAAGKSEDIFQQTSDLQTVSKSQMSVENSVTAEFDQLLFEEKLKVNPSGIFSQSDTQASRANSLSVPKWSVEKNTKKDNVEKAFRSIENYENYSLEDERINIPKHITDSQEMKSIEKKAAKKLPGHELMINTDTEEFINGYEENSNGDYQLSADEALSIDGEQEREIGDSVLGHAVLDNKEFTRRGRNKHSLEIPDNTKSAEAVARETVTLDTAELEDKKVLESKKSEPVHQGNDHEVKNGESVEDTVQCDSWRSSKVSTETVLRVIKAVYDYAL